MKRNHETTRNIQIINDGDMLMNLFEMEDEFSSNGDNFFPNMKHGLPIHAVDQDELG